MRLGDIQSPIKRIHIPEETILLLSDNLDFPPVRAPITDLDQLIIGRVIWSCQGLLK